MEFFLKIKLYFARKTIRGICRLMIKSYKIVKQLNPGVSQQELYALVLSLRRPGWKRTGPFSFTYILDNIPLNIEKSDRFKDMVTKLIIAELFSKSDAEKALRYFSGIPHLHPPKFDKAARIALGIALVVGEEFKHFKE